MLRPGGLAAFFFFSVRESVFPEGVGSHDFTRTRNTLADLKPEGADDPLARLRAMLTGVRPTAPQYPNTQHQTRGPPVDHLLSAQRVDREDEEVFDLQAAIAKTSEPERGSLEADALYVVITYRRDSGAGGGGGGSLERRATWPGKRLARRHKSVARALLGRRPH